MNILLAEDDPINRSIQKRMLEKFSHVVTAVEDGKQAVDIFEPGKFDLILLDKNTPVMNGIEAAKKIREKEGNGSKRTPILALTGGAEDNEFYTAGMDGYIGKPVTLEELKIAIKKWEPK